METRAGPLHGAADRLALRSWLGDHAGADRLVRGLVDHDERAGRAQALVRVGHERGPEAEANAGDGVEVELVRRLVRERRYVEPVLDRGEPGRHGAGRVLDQVAR